MISVSELTAPLAGDDPCGEDLSQGTSLIELEALIRGKPPTQFDEDQKTEEPDWRQALQGCLDLFRRSRDLRVGVSLSLALLKTDGLNGLRDGLSVLRQLVEQQWEKVHPKLDPEDNNDPLQRMNGLSVRAAPLGSMGDVMRFVERVREIPLTNSRQIGRFGLGVILDARNGTSAGGAKPAGPDSAQIEAAFRDTPPAELVVTHQAAGEALEQLRGMNATLQGLVGAAHAPNFSELENALDAIQEIVAPYLASPPSGAAGASDKNASANGSTGGRISGTISSRDDVLRVLEQIRSYYSANEPASPIPLLVRRIERMVPMTFLELMNDMAPDGVNQVKTIVGPQP